tara:strand:- start:527 stop:703 length:177 start_codon:yes stop_codon:yes gene_type:complete
MTPEELKAKAKEIYSCTGITLIHVSELTDENTAEEYTEAYNRDRSYLRGVADTIYDLT